MMSSLLKFALIAAVAVCVCAVSPSGFHSRLAKVKAQTHNSQNKEFQPHSLPCTYKIVESVHLEEDGQMEDEVITYVVRGPLFRVDFDIDEGELIEEVVIRPDIFIADPDSDKVYVEAFHGINININGTQNYLLEAAAGVAEQEDNLNWYLLPWNYINETNGTYYGQNCTVYYQYYPQSEMTVYLYVVDDYIIGLNASADDYLEIHNMTYTFDGPLRDLVVDKKLFPDCNDSRAFNRPLIDPCAVPASSSSHPHPHPHHSSSSASSFSSSFFLVLVAVVSAAAILLL